MRARRPPGRRTAHVAHVVLDAPLVPLAVDAERHDDVLLIAHAGGAVLGQVFIPASPTISPGAQWAALSRALGPDIARAGVTRLFERAAGRPPRSTAPAMPTSVVVCTRDRPDALRRCLRSLAELEADVEVIVVDNASRDDTTRQACDGFDVTYVHEPQPGQSRARNRGAAAAGGELIAYTDDDCVVDPGWLTDLRADFADPLVGAVTGYIGPLELETPAQYLFELHGGFERSAARRVWDPSRVAPAIAAGQVGAGANMVLRREALVAINGFAEDMGPGTPARSGDDKDAYYRLLRAGYRIVYDPARMIWHGHRESSEELRAILFDYGVSEFAYSLRVAVRHGDLDAVHTWWWWLRHYAKEARTHAVRSPERLPFTLLAAEVGGAVRAPVRLVRSARGRRGLPPVPIPPRVATEAAAQPAVRVTGEPPEGISMAIATRNRSARLRTLLQSLGEQRLPRQRFEVIVVVDGATDDSAAMARALAVPYRLRVVEQPPRGLAVTRNRGAREAANPVVVFFDDDIVPDPGLLAAHRDAHAEAPGPRVVLGPYPPADRGTGLWGRRQAAWWHDHFRRKGEPGHRWSFIDYIDGNTSLRPRELAAVGGYDEQFTGGRRQDWELGIRLLRHGWTFVHEPRARGVHHFDGRLETAFRVGREEGRLDVTVARLHPDARAHLPIVFVANQLLSRPGRTGVLHSLAADSAARWRGYLEILRGLERAGRQGAWNRLADRFLLEAYAQGLHDALPDAGERRGFLEWVRSSEEIAAPEPVDLAEPGARAPAGQAPLELDLGWRGWPLGRIQVLRAAENWGWDDVSSRAVDAVMEPGAQRLDPAFLRDGGRVAP